MGLFSVYGNGRTVDLAFAEGHDGGGDAPPEDSYDPGPEGSYECTDCTFDDPGPDGSYECTDCTFDDPLPDGSYECTDCTFDQPAPDGSFTCVDCTIVEPLPGGEIFECTDCNYEGPTAGDKFFECTDCTFDQPPPEYYECADCIFDYSGFEGEYQFEGDFNPDGGEFADPALYEGTFAFDPTGAFVFDGGGYVEGEEQYFPDGEFYDFFDPGDFAHDEFTDTFNPDAFAGDFGDFFQGGDFQSGEFEQFFDPGDYRPEEFGTYFAFEEFNPGDFGNFAAIGEDFIDFGGHFDQFFGDRSEEAFAATEYFSDLAPSEFGFIPPEDLLGHLDGLDYQGFQSLDSDFVYDLFQEGLAGQEFDLQGDQWAGAFSQFDVNEIHGIDQEFLSGAVHDFAPEDFIGIPDDQAFALFESTFFGGAFGPIGGGFLDGEPFGGDIPGGDPFAGVPLSLFDPLDFEQKLDEVEGQLTGFLGAFGQEHYQRLEDGQLVDIFTRIDFTGEDFDPSVLGGDDLGGIFGALDHESFAGMTDDHILDAIGIMEAKDFGAWDPSAAYNVFDNIEFGQVAEFEHLDGLVGAMGLEQFEDLGDEKLVDLITNFAFGGPDFDLAASALDGADVAGLIGSLDGEHLGELGGDGILEALQHLEDKDLGVWAGGTAYDVFSTIGLEQALYLDQLEGIVGNFAAEHIQQLGDNLDGLLGALDFQNNADVLGE